MPDYADSYEDVSTFTLSDDREQRPARRPDRMLLHVVDQGG